MKNYLQQLPEVLLVVAKVQERGVGILKTLLVLRPDLSKTL